ncbi:WbqC family protein [Pontibacter sp. MBLB2868]|uniref:WbqC family protein n=1 Tax=Pontibacter sp. MBLB2868 TaxID=3451555 RepID=UPI003F74EC37
MRLAIMQPYIFPYLGYFQLIQAVDKFVVYDDVSFIKQGWINRNKILLNGEKHFFFIPVEGISSFKDINQTFVSDKPINWEKKILRTIEQAYRKAPFFNNILPIVEASVYNQRGNAISTVAVSSIERVLQYLDIEKNIVESSTVYNNKELKGQDRIIDICKKEDADTYINAIGGVELYEKEYFSNEGIKLFFLKSELRSYRQFHNISIPALSIIDVLMFCPIKQVQQMLTEYHLV